MFGTSSSLAIRILFGHLENVYLNYISGKNVRYICSYLMKLLLQLVISISSRNYQSTG